MCHMEGPPSFKIPIYFSMTHILCAILFVFITDNLLQILVNRTILQHFTSVTSSHIAGIYCIDTLRLQVN